MAKDKVKPRNEHLKLGNECGHPFQWTRHQPGVVDSLYRLKPLVIILLIVHSESCDQDKDEFRDILI